MPDVRINEFERMRNGGARTSVRVQPAGTAVAGYQVPLGNRPSIRDVGVVGAPAWTAEQTETWVRTSVSATCPRRLVVFEGGKKDIDKCMEFGDDFGGPALNMSKWTQFGAGTKSISEGIISIRTPSFSDDTGIQSNGGWGVGYAIHAKLKSNIYQVNGQYINISWKNTGAPIQSTIMLSGESSPKIYNYTTGYSGITAAGWSANTWITTDLVRGGTAISAILGGVVTSHSTQYPITALPIQILVSGNSPTYPTIYVDWIAIRKTSDPEPVAGTAQPSASNRSMCQSLNLADGLRACCAA